MKQELVLKPLESWYKKSGKFNRDQWGYLQLLQEMFNVRTATGQPVPYVMTEYQQEFHAKSLNVKNNKVQDIIFIKARGISFTFCSCIELIFSALTFENQIFPIIAQRQDSAKSILAICKWLIKNANYEFGQVEFQESQIKFLSTNSVIKPYPSGSASDAVRGLRLIRALIDEYAFQQRDKELLAAVQDSMQGELGQILIGSTPAGRNNHFFELMNNPVGFNVFRLPVFDENKFNPEKSILEQDLTPIAPWIDLEKLEIKRRRDVNIFLQEQMCDFLDDSISFLPYSLIMRNVDKELLNYSEVIKDKLDFRFGSENVMYMGVDVARTHDLTAIVVFEKIYLEEEERVVHVMRFVDVIKNMSLPKQQDYIDKVLSRFPQVVKCRVDMTGLGLGLYEYLKKKHGTMIEGIHFASKVSTGEVHQKVSVVERMAVHMKNLLQDVGVRLINDELLIKHLNDVDYDFKAIRRSHSGHGDLFYATGLALLPDKFRLSQVSVFHTNVSANRQAGKKQQALPVLTQEQTEKHQKQAQQLTWEERIEYLRRQHKNQARRFM